MKAFVVALFVGCFGSIAHAVPPQLLLIPLETSIKPGANVRFDVYLWNNGSEPRKVPSL